MNNRIRSIFVALLPVAAMPLLTGLGVGACAAPLDEGSTDEDLILDDGNVDEVSQELGTTQTIGSVPTGNSSFEVSYSSAYAYFTVRSGEFCTPASSVQKMSLTTGSVTNLALNSCNWDPTQSSSDGADLYYLETYNDDIRRVGSSGADAKWADTTGDGDGISVKNYRVYWADESGVHSKATGGISILNHFAGDWTTRLLGVDESYIYAEKLNSSTNQYELHRGTAFGTGSTILWTQSKAYSVFTLKGNYIYWATNPATGLTTIQRMSRTGGTPTTLYSTGAYCIISMAVNNTDLYWSENTSCNLLSGTGQLRRRSNPTGSGTITTPVTGLSGPRGLYLPPTLSYVYWIDGFFPAALKRASLTIPPTSCEGSCGGQAPSGCFCDQYCTGLGDCCSDYAGQCTSGYSCDGICGSQAPGGCWCDTACTTHGDCCSDYAAMCL